MAKPYPLNEPVFDWIAVLIPIKLPLVLINAPPEFPSLIAASVWINDSIPPSLSILIFRDLAQIIPAVTVEFRLNEFPTANTHWPIFRLFESSNLR